MPVIKMKNPKKPDPAGQNVLYYEYGGDRHAVAPGAEFPIDLTAAQKKAMLDAGFAEVT